MKALHALVATLLVVVGAEVWASGFVSPGDLAQDHAELEGLANCTKCHEPFSEGVSAARCIDCHDEIQAQIDRGHGFHARRNDTCERCHPDHRGRDFELVQFDEERFNHATTGFPLDGEHEDLDCVDCHEDESSWAGLDRECLSCHMTDEPHGGEESDRTLLLECDACHTTADWSALPILESIFNHVDSEYVDYPLEGAHEEVECEDCHEEWRFVPIEFEACLDCHDDPHRADLPGVCEDCHPTPHSWEVRGFDHDLTPYHLEGLHEEVTCRECHGGDVTRPLRYDRCDDCHDGVHGDQFEPRDCDSCHDLVQPEFQLLEFDHDSTDYPLTGAHQSTECEDCHLPSGHEGVPTLFNDLPADSCQDCHDDIHEERFAPKECDECHSTAGWKVDDFDHDLTEYPLEGAHEEVECVECHGELTDGPTGPSGEPLGESSFFSSIESFELDFSSCNTCHEEQSPHDATVADDTCDGCHNLNDWEVDEYDHEPEFTLGRAHEELGCDECHDPEYVTFEGLEADCVSCHQEDEPTGHYEGGSCDECHEAAEWTPAVLSRASHRFTGFPLTMSHDGLLCEECHPGAESGASYGSVSGDCAGCHGSEDIHRNLLGNECEECHTVTRWMRSTWRHSSIGWPLRGGHKMAECEDCHAVSYAGTPTDCWRCHESEMTLLNSAHMSSFARECDVCHRPYSWDAVISF